MFMHCSRRLVTVATTASLMRTSVVVVALCDHATPMLKLPMCWEWIAGGSGRCALWASSVCRGQVALRLGGL
ncbi:hypothetical protein ACLOJK_015283, partial [Asimina triloba]